MSMLQVGVMLSFPILAFVGMLCLELVGSCGKIGAILLYTIIGSVLQLAFVTTLMRCLEDPQVFLCALGIAVLPFAIMGIAWAWGYGVWEEIKSDKPWLAFPSK